MKYYLIAGEASGDMHGSYLMNQISQNDKSAEFRFWGGNRMAEIAKTDPIKHYKDLAFMGFAEVISNIRTILRNIEFCKTDINFFKPDIIIFIDYPGFNLRIAEFAHNQKIKTAYYISPQIWAWKESRINKIKKNIDLMMVILPFEEAFYAKHNYKANFVGHPLLDHIDMERQEIEKEEKILALVPGSRKQEVEKMLPLMLKAAKSVKFNRIIIAATSHLPSDIYSKAINDTQVEIEYDDMHKVLRQSTVALVTSGTATLETALLKIPQVVCYKTSNISYQIAKRLVKVKYISLVNLIMDKPVVKELIQNDLNEKNIIKELKKILPGNNGYLELMKNYAELPDKLGGKGASSRAAQLVINIVKTK